MNSNLHVATNMYIVKSFKNFDYWSSLFRLF